MTHDQLVDFFPILDKLSLDRRTTDELLQLLSIHQYKWPLALEEMWHLLDLVWDELGCDNTKPDLTLFEHYYAHPVWLLNGFFIESHAESMAHRIHIANWITAFHCTKVLDFGGGFSTLARQIVETTNDTHVDIYEPFPSEVATAIIAKCDRARFVKTLTSQYDCIVVVDVFEHLTDPMAELLHLLRFLKPDGYLVLANCFHPVIKCHLPSTFHLRYTFGKFLRPLGIRFVEGISNSYAESYRKIDATQPNKMIIRSLEYGSRLSYPFFNFRKTIARYLSS